ncbi:hypothetical protein J8J14_13325 [Roseomonas sp. SSH11]|uniref:Uncharacterized protein n=1 Tax=Pararoseomonas baculiformis TaxID=2820812 RepID=A0ABS4AFI0_9PROT|nr:hypothetical protein [Pararoseomonas baculiformis]MBP0445756.1 hypothetical protein [Pararoseomonas baculiformis]
MARQGWTRGRGLRPAGHVLGLVLAVGAAAPALAADPVPSGLLLPVQAGPPKSPAPSPASPPASRVALSPGDAAQAPPLQPDRPVQVTLRRGQQAFFRIAPEAGEAWRVETRRLARGTDTVLATLDEAGDVLSEDDDGGGEELASRLEAQPGDGVRLIRAGTLENQGGRFELVLTREQPLPPPDFATDQASAAGRPPLTLGQPVRVRLRRGQHAFFALPEERTDLIAATRALSRGADTELALLDASGQVVARNDDGGEGLASLLPLMQGSGPMTLRASLVDGGTGSFEVVLEREAPSPEPDYPTSLEQARSRGPLNPGQTLRIELGRGRQAVFALPEGQALTLSTRDLGENVDTVLALLDDQGEVLLEDDDGGGGLASRLRTADASGRAAFIRASLLDGGRGSFELVVQGAQQTTTETGPAAELEEARRRPTLILGEALRLRMDAAEDRYIALPHDGRPALAMTFGLAPEVDTELALLDENGTVLAENDDADGLASRLEIPPAPRPAFLRIRLLEGAGGEFNLVLVRPAP